MTSSLERRLDKLGPELPTFEEWHEQNGWGEFRKGPPYPWREGTFELYEKKFREMIKRCFPEVDDPEGDPPS